MKTKDKIIESAIQLFNNSGVSNVTIRQIAAKIGISHGNLEYYYKNKEILIVAIYNGMTEEMSKVYPDDETIELTFRHFHLLLMHLEQFQLKYRFFHQDLLEITRKYAAVSPLLAENIQIRKRQMRKYFENFLKQKFLLEEPEEGYYLRLQYTILIMITFWLPQNEVLTSFNFDQNVEMTKHVWELLIPNMTKSGIKEYQKTMEEQ